MSNKKIKLGITNCYLLPVDGKYLLIDTGCPWEWELFQKKLNQEEIQISEIKYLFLTHHHRDHVGLVNELIKANPEITIIASRQAKDSLSAGKHFSLPEVGYLNRRIEFVISTRAKLAKHWADLSFSAINLREKDILIDNDTSLKAIGVNIEGKIIMTPGHTQDSLSLVLSDGACFCGDAAYNMFQFIFGTKYCVIFVDDLEQYYQSWIKIMAEKPEIIYPGHGRSFKAERLKNNLYKNKKKNMVAFKS